MGCPESHHFSALLADLREKMVRVKRMTRQAGGLRLLFFEQLARLRWMMWAGIALRCRHCLF